MMRGAARTVAILALALSLADCGGIAGRSSSSGSDDFDKTFGQQQGRETCEKVDLAAGRPKGSSSRTVLVSEAMGGSSFGYDHDLMDLMGDDRGWSMNPNVEERFIHDIQAMCDDLGY